MATITLDGEAVPVLRHEDLTLGELAFVAEAFGIPGMVGLELGVQGLEPTAWRALLIVSARRVVPDADPWTDELDGLNFMALVREIAAEREADALSVPEGDGD